VTVPSLEATLEEGVLRLRIRRPERANALTPEMLGTLARVLRDPPADARVALVCSEGDRVFSAGADLSMMGDANTPSSPSTEAERQAKAALAGHEAQRVLAAAEAHRARGAVREAMLAILESPLVVVARVQGHCLAGAVGIALACDLVVCAETAEWGFPEVDRGIWPFMVSALLLRHVGPKLAMDWMSTGRRFSAAEAHGAGLVSRLVPDAALDAEVEQLLDELRAKAPLALAAGKAAARAVVEMPLGVALEAMHAQLSLLVASEDAAEGVAAFAQRRAPVWRGR
jgi:enoyl-CoA hydratase/carnithine racemase